VSHPGHIGGRRIGSATWLTTPKPKPLWRCAVRRLISSAPKAPLSRLGARRSSTRRRPVFPCARSLTR